MMRRANGLVGEKTAVSSGKSAISVRIYSSDRSVVHIDHTSQDKRDYYVGVIANTIKIIAMASY
jgi:hypothetical protein